MKTELIERKGKQFVLVPLKEFERLVDNAEMLEDIKVYDEAKAKNEEIFPHEVAEAILAGESPVKLFRNYRGLTQVQLAKKAKIARPYLAEIESGKKQGSVKVLKAIAKVLDLEIGDIT